MVFYPKFGWTLRDEKMRKFYSSTEIKKRVLKSLLSDLSGDCYYKIYFSNKFCLFSKKSSISFYRNSCMIRKVGKVVFKDLKLGRIMAKHYCSEGNLVGFRKSSF